MLQSASQFQRFDLLNQLLFETIVCDVPIDTQTYIKMILATIYDNKKTKREKEAKLKLLQTVFRNDSTKQDFKFAFDIIDEHVHAKPFSQTQDEGFEDLSDLGTHGLYEERPPSPKKGKRSKPPKRGYGSEYYQATHRAADSEFSEDFSTDQTRKELFSKEMDKQKALLKQANEKIKSKKRQKPKIQNNSEPNPSVFEIDVDSNSMQTLDLDDLNI